MSNPLRMFRKYQAAFLVAFGVMLMIAFVVGPILSDYLSNRASMGTGGNPVVVTWSGGELTEADIDNMRAMHMLTTKFLRQLVSRIEVLQDDVVVTRGKQQIKLKQGMTFPVVGSGEDPVTKQPAFEIIVGGESVMVPPRKEGSDAEQVAPVRSRVQLITQATGEEELIRRMLLAEEAKKQGVVISQGAVLDYLDGLCNVTEDTRPDYAAMLRNSTGGRIDMRRFMAQMSMELAAQRIILMSQGGLFPTPPEFLYQCYNKLNRRVTAELLAVKVEDYIDQLQVEPTQQDLLALYEEGKNRFHYPTVPEPGFKQRKQIKFQFVMGRFDEFLEREVPVVKPTITDEQIEEYYEQNKDALYQVIELPEEEDATEPPKTESGDDATEMTEEAKTESPGGDPTSSDTQGTEGAKAEPGSAEPTKTEPAKTEPEKTEPAETEPTTSEPATSEPAKSDPAKSDPAKTEPAKTEPAETEPVKTEPAKTEPAKEDAGQDQVSRSDDGMIFVSYQEQGAPAQPAESQAEEPAAEQAAEGQDDQPSLNEPAKQQDPKTDPAAESEATEAKTNPQGDATALDQATMEGEAAKTESEPAKTEGESGEQEPEKPVEYKPLDDELREEIRDRLARQLARDPALEKLEDAIEKARTQVEQYSREVSRALLQEKEPPPPLDMAPVAKQLQLAYGETPLWDTLDVTEIRRRDASADDPTAYELARATETVFGQMFEQRRRTLATVAFEGDSAPYSPRRLVDGAVSSTAFPTQPQKVFIYWRVEEVPEKVPEFDEIKDEVERAWKLRAALQPAEEAAADMAQKARDAAQPLAEVFPQNADAVIETMQFSWMTRGSTPAAMGGRPMLSPINGFRNDQPVTIDGAGNEFMRSVFDLDVGDVGVATNEPETFVYVVRLVGEELSDEERRGAFYTIYGRGATSDIDALVQEEQAQIIRGWFDDIEASYNVDWKREPNNNWGRQQ